jgi:arylsulfatase A-like enzyme
MAVPNIILINCDDLGYGDLGCYGSTVNKTPTLDKMAREGLLLTDFYMASPVCSPSRGAMLTGCYPARIGFADFDGAGVLFPGDALGLSSKETTIATLLQEQGYETMLLVSGTVVTSRNLCPPGMAFPAIMACPIAMIWAGKKVAAGISRPCLF